MHFMIIERFRGSEAVPAVYQRFAEQGRLMPEGLKYVGNWVEPNFDRCFLVAECEDPRLIQHWVLQCNDLIELEIIPVVPSKETADVVASFEDSRVKKVDPAQSRTSRSTRSRVKRPPG